MFSKIAAAKAFLDAGNAPRAKTEIESVLRDDPHNGMALDVYALVLRELEDWDMVETISKDRLARDPTCTWAYANLILRYRKANRRREAKLLREQYTASVLDPSGIETLNKFYEICFGDKAAAWTELSEEAAAKGDHRASFNMASKAAFERGDIWAALQEAEFARRTGDNSGTNLARISVLNFRMMRFARCRSFARLALQADPTLPLPKELLVLSWLVYFPPFWVGSFFVLLVFFAGKFGRVITFVSFYLLGPILLLPAFFFLDWFASLVRVPFWFMVVVATAYVAYVSYALGTIAQYLYPSRGSPVKLDDY